MSKHLTIAELAEKADIPNSTCRRYLTAFESFFIVKGGSRLKKYEAGSVDILKRIKQLYEEGQDTNEIYSVLVNEFPLVINGDEKETTNEAPVPSLATSEDVAEIRQTLAEQKQFYEALLEKLDKQYELLEQRDKMMLESIREMQETKKLIATTEKPEPENKSWFSKLFKK